jgi:phospholipase C
MNGGVGGRGQQIDHIVVLMMENRSFDHMLGYLSLPDEGPGSKTGGRGREDVDGFDAGVLRNEGTQRNIYDHHPPFYPTPISDAGETKAQDPCHTGWCVAQQMSRGMGGFVANYATTREGADPGDVMQFQCRHDVPVYDFLSEHFAVLDRWFCSVPGSTWPNRLAALSGTAKSRDNRMPPLYDHRSFVRNLDEKGVSWRWYSSDPGSLRLIDGHYRVGYEDHFACSEKPTMAQPRTFFRDVANDDLPQVSWIDPNFVDLGGLQGANDDHPPTDAMAGQSFVLKIYSALADSNLSAKTMLVITYDEHGGFYDHVSPVTTPMPETFASDRPEFDSFGPRVPTFVISPFTASRSAYGSKQGTDERFFYDHTSLIRTILWQFADDDCEGLPDRVATAQHLYHTLELDQPREWPEPEQGLIDEVASWWAQSIGVRLRYPMAQSKALLELEPGAQGAQGALQSFASWFGRVVDSIRRLFGRTVREQSTAAPTTALTDPNDLEKGIAAAARNIRGQGLPPGQP